MAKSKGVHTVPSPNGKGWINKQDGDTVSRHRTKENAVERGREIARQDHAEHTVHKKDGTISQKNSYGGDPIPPRDRNR